MKTKDIYIIGNGGFAKEVYSLILDIGGYNFRGFIDYKPKNKKSRILEKEFDVVDEDTFIQDETLKDCCLAIGIGNPSIIRNIQEKFAGYDFPNLIHPESKFNQDLNKLGKGNIITAGVIFTVGVEVGDFNIFNLSCTVGHNAVIKNYNVVNPSVNISGNVTIGDCNLLGVGAVILQDLSIGNNSIVGASSLVTKNVDNNKVVVGVPAKERS